MRLRLWDRCLKKIGIGLFRFARTFGDVTRLGAVGPQIHRRAYRHSGPSNDLVHSIPTPGSNAHMVIDPLTVSNSFVRKLFDLPGQIWSRVNVRLDRNQGGQGHAQETIYARRDYSTSANG